MKNLIRNAAAPIVTIMAHDSMKYCRLVVIILLTNLGLLTLAESSQAMEPGEVAKEFYQHIVAGEIQSASEMATEKDRKWPQPIGRYSPQFKPTFPSAWTVSVETVVRKNNQSTVVLRVSYPEIEDIISQTGIAGTVSERVLQEYFDRRLPMSHFEVSVELIFENGTGWRVKTYAKEYAWDAETRYPPKVDMVNPNLAEIRAFRDRLLKKFPDRPNEIEEISAPLLAKAYAAAGAVFSGMTIDPNNPRWRDGIYDIGFTYENKSDFVVESLEVAIILRDASKKIVERDTAQVFYSGDLPQGLPPHGQLVEHVPLEATNSNETPVSVEISIIDLEARPKN